MEFNFIKRQVIILGSSSGIGFELASQLSRLGASVCLVGREDAKLNSAYSQLEHNNFAEQKNLYFCCDLTDVNAINSLWDFIQNQWNGQVDSIVLNSGGPPFITSVTEINTNEWFTYFQSLFISQISLVCKSLSYMKSINFGRVVSISSSGIIEPLQGLGISNSIRSSLHAWLKTLSLEVASNGINITTAVIGKVATDRLMSIDKNRSKLLNCTVDEIIRKNCHNIPIGRYGRTNEAAESIIFLLSKYSSYINGSYLLIDGGSIKKSF